METESLYYFMETAKSLHMSETAQRLYMSPQTLSNHIARVEEHYEAKLFNRRPNLELTEKGRAVLDFASKFTEEEKNLKDRLKDIELSEYGELHFGATSPRYTVYLPGVLKDFTDRYPNVRLHLADQKAVALEQMLKNNELDFAVCVGPHEDVQILEEIHAFEDPVYFCVSDTLLKKRLGEKGARAFKKKARRGIEATDTDGIPLLMLLPNNRLGKRLYQCFENAGVKPEVFLRAGFNNMLMQLCNDGLAGGFTSKMNMISWRNLFSDEINICPMLEKGEAVKVPLFILKNRHRYMNHHARFFLDVLKKHISALEAIDVHKITPQ